MYEEETRRRVTWALGGQSHLASEPRVLSGESCEFIFWPIILDVVKENMNFDYYPVVFIFK